MSVPIFLQAFAVLLVVVAAFAGGEALSAVRARVSLVWLAVAFWLAGRLLGGLSI